MKTSIVLLISIFSIFNLYDPPGDPIFTTKNQSFITKYYKGGLVTVTYTAPFDAIGFEITIMSGSRPIKIYYTGKMKKGESKTVTANVF